MLYCSPASCVPSAFFFDIFRSISTWLPFLCLLFPCNLHFPVTITQPVFFFLMIITRKKKQTVSPIDAVLSTFWLPNVSPLETCRRSATGPCENKRLFLAADGTVPSTSSFRPSFLLPNFVVCFEILDCRILVHVGRLVGRCRVVERRGPKNISTSTGDENGRLVRSIFNAAD